MLSWIDQRITVGISFAFFISVLFKTRCDMAKTHSKQNNKQRSWTFSLEAPEAKEVFLMGDFNDWKPGKHPMQKDENGIWKKQVMLSPGNYEYKFLVDGQWKEDPRNNRRCPNRFGSYNSVIRLPGV
jgi:1,4-alpha-glucan branching enzyme